jgi:hypothetical protein
MVLESTLTLTTMLDILLSGKVISSAKTQIWQFETARMGSTLFGMDLTSGPRARAPMTYGL